MTTAARRLPHVSHCEQEAIHAPGSIQPHGFLFLLSPTTWRIVGASANTREFFWREASALIGTRIGLVLGAEVEFALVRARRHPDFRNRAVFVRQVNLEVPGETRVFALLAHATEGGVVVLEGEPAAELPPLQVEHELQSFLSRLTGVESVEELEQLAVQEMRRITGFDRCLLYQFDADWNGAVVAEDRNDRLPAYLHQHFPASDIPRQARELYRRNHLRMIPTSDYRPVPLVLPAEGPSAAQIDLSLAQLRSVSPVHLEYMRNMGTGSSMSVAVLRGGELWGLLSCHSREPRTVPFATRTACDLLAQFLALQMAVREQARELAQRVALAERVTRIAGDMARAQSLKPISGGEDLLRLAGAIGVAVVEGADITAYGTTPPKPELAALAAVMIETGHELLATTEVSRDFPLTVADEAGASGVLGLVLRRTPATAILWFRPEMINVISWGGEPRKAIEATGEGLTLHPRKSFEVWRETVRGRSLAWEPAVLSAVRELRRIVLDFIIPPRGEP